MFDYSPEIWLQSANDCSLAFKRAYDRVSVEGVDMTHMPSEVYAILSQRLPFLQENHRKLGLDSEESCTFLRNFFKELTNDSPNEVDEIMDIVLSIPDNNDYNVQIKDVFLLIQKDGRIMPHLCIVKETPDGDYFTLISVKHCTGIIEIFFDNQGVGNKWQRSQYTPFVIDYEITCKE